MKALKLISALCFSFLFWLNPSKAQESKEFAPIGAEWYGTGGVTRDYPHVSSNLSSQNYVPFQPNSVWSVNTDKFMAAGDTVINGKEYMKVYLQKESNPFEFDMANASYFCAMRNDTIDRRVYGVYHKASHVIDGLWTGQDGYLSDDTSEFLLYDFSLQMGDTVTVASFEHEIDKIILLVARRTDAYYFGYYDNNVYIEYSVSNADSLMLLENAGVARRIIVDFSLNDHNNVLLDQMWIEGIGSSSGLFSHSSYFDVNADDRPRFLICHQNSDEITYRTAITVLDRDRDCFSTGGLVSINEYEAPQTSFSIYPNPTEGMLFVKLEYTADDFPFNGTVFNSVGQELCQFNISETITEVSLNDFPPGIYFLKISNKEKIVQNGKIIIK